MDAGPGTPPEPGRTAIMETDAAARTSGNAHGMRPEELTDMRTYGGMTAEARISARRRCIMESGLELFSTLGYPQTSIRSVLRHSGVRERYFTESFSSLDELMAAILREIQEEETGRCREALDAGGTRRDRARGMLEVLTRGVTDDPRRSRVKLIESLSAGPLAASERRRGMRHLAALVESLLLEGWHDPEINTTAMSMAVVGGVNQILLNWVDGVIQTSREDVVQQSLYLFEAIAEFGAGTPRT
ncbi:TetR/AcrR family transcriptional regulator [Streptomyces gibsoniae]|uniref:TetR/AcrR family transcriptional regulator n=1 Tax=Streptomyces gibsoniae TaxID=3075529 RepID=A0ABU2U4R5_9ACTN|nr:TetR/AcrR family transcriptional regulator [Streptomyces sp. DSM 41699]MDT0468159.1 TetR/AcrR family transcriptional regulator [Streptomyces sp. DSM 41699]